MTFDQKAYNRAYYQANKERLNAQAREWQAANPEKVRAYKRKNERARHARYYEQNREAIIARVLVYSGKNSGRLFIRRRAWAGEVQKEATPPWLTAEQEKAIQWFYDEARRLTEEMGVRHVVDHIAPLNGAHSCGLHVPWNLQVLTDSENKSKRFGEDRHF